MGKIEVFKIALEKRPAIFQPGEKLSGRVLIRTSEKFSINSIYVNLVGECKVHWTENDGTKAGSKSDGLKHFKSSENYFSVKLLLLTKKKEQENLEMGVGEFSYYFDMLLPTNLPTSFDHGYARVRYLIDACIDIPWESNKHTVRLFTVISPYDLNSIPALRQPYGVQASKIICCGPCKSDPILCTFSVKKCGYASGETIEFDVTIDNQSSREIKEIMISFIQKLKFHAKKEIKRCTRRVAMIAYPKKMGPKCKESWCSTLVIPPSCPTSNGKARFIEIYYTLLCTFDASGLASSTDLIIPITIGTKPLANEDPNSMPIPPVKYEMCHFEPSKFGENFFTGEMFENDLDTFKPYYPYYKS